MFMLPSIPKNIARNIAENIAKDIARKYCQKRANMLDVLELDFMLPMAINLLVTRNICMVACSSYLKVKL